MARPLFHKNYFAKYTHIEHNTGGLVVYDWEELQGRSVWFEGNCSICIVHTTESKEIRKQTSILFKNDGVVAILGYGDISCRRIDFFNAGNVVIDSFYDAAQQVTSVAEYIVGADTSTKIHRTKLSFVRGKMVVASEKNCFFGEKVFFGENLNIGLHCNGDLTIVNREKTLRNLTIDNGGIFRTESANIKNCVISSRKGVDIRGKNHNSEIAGFVNIHNCVFRGYGVETVVLNKAFLQGKNKFTGRCSYRFSDLLSTGDEMVFDNHRFVSIEFHDGVTFRDSHKVAKTAVFANGRNVNITYPSDRGVIDGGHIQFTNVGSVCIRGLSEIKSGIVFFRNNGFVRLSDLRRLPAEYTDGHVHFLNGYDVEIPNLENVAINRSLEIRNGRNVHAPVHIYEIIGDTSLLSPGGHVMCGKKFTYFSNKSFLMRYNVKVDNGYVELYKGVSDGRKMASYDGCSDQWLPGTTNTNKSWNPYANEIGKGKYVASYSPKVFGKLLSYKHHTVYVVRIAVEDLYEWPTICAEHPEFIGFRKGTVVGEYIEESRKTERYVGTETPERYRIERFTDTEENTEVYQTRNGDDSQSA